MVCLQKQELIERYADAVSDYSKLVLQLRIGPDLLTQYRERLHQVNNAKMTTELAHRELLDHQVEHGC